MENLETYLRILEGKVFKLLPMREARDRGEDNHIDEYLVNLCANYSGSFDCYPTLKAIREMVETYGNIMFLKNNQEIDFRVWRSMVLRSTRLIHAVITRLDEEV